MLALKYRPTSLDDVVGQKTVSTLLKAMIIKNQVPSAMLFCGPRGTGKTSTARLVAKAVLDSQGADFSDIIEIDAASHGGVEDIRKLRESMMFSGRRIVILDEAHSMSKEAFNALLKAMEEPEDNATYILVTTEPNRIPETIRSRCMQFDFKRISVKDIYERLVYVVDCENYSGKVGAGLLEFISFKADGGMRDALMLLDQALRAGIHHVEQYEDVLGQLDTGPDMLKACFESTSAAISAFRRARRYLSPEEIIDEMVETVSDILLLREGVEIPRSGKPLEDRKKLSQELNLAQALKIMQVLWSLKTRPRIDNPAKTLELAIAVISTAFHDATNLSTKVSRPEQKAEAPKKASLSDLAGL